MLSDLIGLAQRESQYDGKNTKLELIIMRGISGSGKSTKAKQLSSEVPNSVICSADDFFMKDGQYNFNAKQLGIAHAICLRKAVSAMKQKVERVIIDNTNTQKREFKKYEQCARDSGYSIRFEVVGELDEASLEVYANRNLHGVPLDVIRKQANRFQQ